MLTDGLEWFGLLWCFYQTLILTAPIHCRASIAETLMQRHISTDLMKKQTHPKHSLISRWTLPLTLWSRNWGTWVSVEHVFTLRYRWMFFCDMKCQNGWRFIEDTHTHTLPLSLQSAPTPTITHTISVPYLHLQTSAGLY